MNITEDYVSFEVAKLLKEKGFNEPCRDFYRKENDEWLHRNTYEYNYFNLQMPRWEGCYSCPTHQMAMRWLREIHDIFIVIEPYSNVSCYFSFWQDDNYYENPLRKGFPSYEETVDAALKYCLENLILL